MQIHGDIIDRSAGEGATAETRPVDSMDGYVAYNFEGRKIGFRLVIEAAARNDAYSRAAACEVKSEVRQNLARGGMIRKKKAIDEN
jgi:hypothetical protein